MGGTIPFPNYVDVNTFNNLCKNNTFTYFK